MNWNSGLDICMVCSFTEIGKISLRTVALKVSVGVLVTADGSWYDMVVWYGGMVTIPRQHGKEQIEPFPTVSPSSR